LLKTRGVFLIENVGQNNSPPWGGVPKGRGGATLEKKKMENESWDK